MILKKNYNWVIFNFDYIQHNEFMCVLKVKFLKSYSVSDSDGYLGITQWFNLFLWDFQCEMWSQSGHMYYSHYSVCNIVIKNFSTCSSISKYESYTDDCFWLITSIHWALKMMLTDNFDVSDTARVSQLLWILVWERNINVIKFTLIHKTWRKLFSKQLLLLKFGLRQQKSCWQPA